MVVCRGPSHGVDGFVGLHDDVEVVDGPACVRHGRGDAFLEWPIHVRAHPHDLVPVGHVHEVFCEGPLVSAVEHVVERAVFEVGDDGDLSDALDLDLVDAEECGRAEPQLLVIVADVFLEHVLDGHMGQRVVDGHVAERGAQGTLRNVRVGARGHHAFLVHAVDVGLPDVVALAATPSGKLDDQAGWYASHGGVRDFERASAVAVRLSAANPASLGHRTAVREPYVLDPLALVDRLLGARQLAVRDAEQVLDDGTGIIGCHDRAPSASYTPEVSGCRSVFRNVAGHRPDRRGSRWPAGRS